MIDDADRVAVRRRLLAGLRRHDARSAAHVLDHERLAKPLLQLCRRGAHDDIGHRASGDRDNHLHRPVWIALRQGRARRHGKNTDERKHCEAKHCEPRRYSFFHSVSLSIFLFDSLTFQGSTIIRRHFMYLSTTILASARSFLREAANSPVELPTGSR
jgi:hypothetical protein